MICTNHNTCDCYRLKALIKKYHAASVIIMSYKTKKSSSKPLNANDDEGVNDGDDDDNDGKRYHYTRVVDNNEFVSCYSG